MTQLDNYIHVTRRFTRWQTLIKSASDRLVLISPYLKLNDRIKDLLEDKNRLKIDVRIVYGKNELQPEEINWLRELTFIRTSFCKNLHAKCYLNEETCIITSLNLYEFSQINNNEMGVLLSREEDGELYREAYEEAQRIIRISDEIRISLERVSNDNKEPNQVSEPGAQGEVAKLTTSKLGKKTQYPHKGALREAYNSRASRAQREALFDRKWQVHRRGVSHEQEVRSLFSLARKNHGGVKR